MVSLLWPLLMTSQAIPCVEGVDGPTRCLNVSVAENPRVPQGRRLLLRVVVAAATGTGSRGAPVLVLSGGPGEAGTAAAGGWARAMAALRVRHDLVFVDVRGTGASGRLDCNFLQGADDYVGSLYPPRLVERCARELSSRADLAQYTTLRIAQDLDVVRRALGYRAWFVFALSHGTRVAVRHAQLFRGRVRGLVLKSAVPPELIAPTNYARDAQRAWDALALRCQAAASCEGTGGGGLNVLLERVLAGARTGMLRIRVPVGDADSAEVALTPEAVTTLMVGLLQGAEQSVAIPRILTAAAAGDARALGALLIRYRRGAARSIAMGHHLSVACSEDAVRIDAASADSVARGTFLGSTRVVWLLDACAMWPVARDPQMLSSQRRVKAPALLVSGAMDPNTPPEWAERMRRLLPDSRHVVLTGVSHFWSQFDKCGADLISGFIEAPKDPLRLAGCEQQ